MTRPLSQEGLKLIACGSMLIDHIGAVFFPRLVWLRILGRMAFPIYAFLLAQGVRHTRSPGRYALRLAVAAVIAELPFDCLFFGGFTWGHQNVMLTLLIAFGTLLWTDRVSGWEKLVPLAAGFLLAEFCRTDYGGWGVAIAWVFAVLRDRHPLIRGGGLALTLWLMGSASVAFGPVRIPIQLFALAALVPIALYSGKKTTDSKLLKTGFYLFYSVHMLALLAAAALIP